MPVYRISQAARLLGVSADTVRRWGDAGRLSVHRDEGGRRWVDGDQLAVLAGSLAEEGEQGAIHYSTRNRLTGIVTKVIKDRVMSQVEVAAGPFRLVSLISTEAVEELELDVGVMVVASVKATNVTLETPADGYSPPSEDALTRLELAVAVDDDDSELDEDAGLDDDSVLEDEDDELRTEL